MRFFMFYVSIIFQKNLSLFFLGGGAGPEKNIDISGGGSEKK